jgi:hypothetical protein
MTASSAAALVAAIRAGGGALTVTGERLSYRLPPDLNTPATLAALRAHKPAILAALADPTPRHPAWSASGRSWDCPCGASVAADWRRCPVCGGDDPDLAATVANASALPPEERDGWQREIVAALRWTEAGHDPDGYLAHDVAALRRLVPYGVCLDCGGPAPRDGRHWCAACRDRGPPQPSGYGSATDT